MSDIEPETDSYGTVLTLTPTQMAALEADPEALTAFREVLDGVTVGEFREVLDGVTVIAYQCAHHRNDPETLLDVATDAELRAEVKERRASGDPGWSEKARNDVIAKRAKETKAKRAAKLKAFQDAGKLVTEPKVVVAPKVVALETRPKVKTKRV